MTSRDFCFWFQGFLELTESKELSQKQLETIRNHLNMVFVHEIDPSIPDSNGFLQNIHDGKVQIPNGLIMRC
jgi:hypothetical protein